MLNRCRQFVRQVFRRRARQDDEQDLALELTLVA